jgi:CHAD domain-containing protein
MNGEFPAELAAHLRDSVKMMRRRYRKRLARCQQEFSETSVHDLRIETRRMLAMLDLLRALHFQDSLRKIRKTFKQRLDAFDELRDTQVQLLLLRPLWRDFPEAREFDPLLRRRERRLIGELGKEIKRMKHVRLERRLRTLEKYLRKSASAKSTRSAKSLAAAALRETFNHVADLRKRVQRNHTATIHRLRVSFKRFRYVSELLQTFFPRLTTRRLREMQAYQGLMGDIQDMEVLIAAVKQAVQLALIPARDVRELLRDLSRRREALIEKFMLAADRLFEFHPDKFAQKT